MPAVTRNRKQGKEDENHANVVDTNHTILTKDIKNQDPLSAEEQKAKAKEWAISQGIFMGKKTPAKPGKKIKIKSYD